MAEQSETAASAGLSERITRKRAEDQDQERIFAASQWYLMWLHFKRHRLALAGSVVVILLYLMAIFAPFLTPYGKLERDSDFVYSPPQKIYFYDGSRFYLRPFVYGIISTVDGKTFTNVFEIDKSVKYPVQFFARGYEYKLFGLIPMDRHLYSVGEGGTIYLLGTDDLGRDLLTRIFAGAGISLSIGLVGVFTSFILGAVLGGVSGYYGGAIDNVIQRVVELLLSVPTIPLWMALSAAVPKDWSALRTYFAVTIILSLRGWCGMARVVRGKLLELREEDFVMAAQLSGASDWRIIVWHLLPAFMSYLIVQMTLAIPGMILGETALSFLGLGLRPPVVSWGVLLHEAQNVRTVAVHAWLLFPALFVIVTVLSFNLMGDGLRDAADPYKL
jgi:peptide/nickel transport system permease protein